MIPGKMQLDEYQKIVENNPMQKNAVRRTFAESYQEFIDIFYDDLDIVIDLLDENPQLSRKNSEDEITGVLIMLFKMLGYDASHGRVGGGSKDITVIGRNPAWSWIGEAKKFNSVADLSEGFKQLTTRYRNVSSVFAQGGLLAYNFQDDAAGRLEGWMKKLVGMKLPNFTIRPCQRRPGLAYHSVHKHKATGLPFDVRHIIVSLNFAPEDKSGRTAKTYQQPKARTKKAAA